MLDPARAARDTGHQEKSMSPNRIERKRLATMYFVDPGDARGGRGSCS